MNIAVFWDLFNVMNLWPCLLVWRLAHDPLQRLLKLVASHGGLKEAGLQSGDISGRYVIHARGPRAAGSIGEGGSGPIGVIRFLLTGRSP